MITNFTSIAHLKELDYHSLYLFSWFKHVSSQDMEELGRSWEKKEEKISSIHENGFIVIYDTLSL